MPVTWTFAEAAVLASESTVFCDTVWPAVVKSPRCHDDRLPGGGGHPVVRVRARGGKVADGVAGDGVDPGGGDDAANLPSRLEAGVVIVEVGHRVARDARAARAGAKDARDLLASC